MTAIQIIAADPSHIAAIAGRLRKADRQQIAADPEHRTPAGVLSWALEQSGQVAVATISGRPEALLGVVDLRVEANVGILWLFGTSRLEHRREAFLHAAAEWLPQLLERYAILRGMISDDDEAGTFWLRGLGFRLLESENFGGRALRIFEVMRCVH